MTVEQLKEMLEKVGFEVEDKDEELILLARWLDDGRAEVSIILT